MDRRYRNMHTIFGGLLWQQPSPDKLRTEPNSLLGQDKARQTGEYGKPSLGCFLVTTLSLAEYKLGNDEVEVLAPSLPPLYCNLLVRSRNDRPAGARREITDDRSFYIDAPPHAFTLPHSPIFFLPSSTVNSPPLPPPPTPGWP